MLERDGKFRLSPRERQVLSLLCAVWPDKRIAAELGISAGTTGTYVRRLLSVSGCHTRGALREFTRLQPHILDGEQGNRRVL